MDNKEISLIVFLTLIVIGSVHLIFLFSIITFFYDVRYVATGSMEPFIPKNSIVVIDKSNEPVILGEVVMYHYSEAPNYKLLHRVVGYQNGLYLIKGDAMPQTDYVKQGNIDGKFLFGLPLLGEIKQIALLDPLFIAVLLISIIGFIALLEFKPNALNRPGNESDGRVKTE